MDLPALLVGESFAMPILQRQTGQRVPRKLLVGTYVNEKARPACCVISIPLGIKVYLASKPVSTQLGLPPSRAAAAAAYSPVCERQDSA